MAPFVAEIGVALKQDAPAKQVLKPANVSQIASLFGVDEQIGTGVYALLEGDTQGLLMLATSLPATKAIEIATEAFRAFARGVGGYFEEPWALVDMRSTLATSLAAQTGSLELAVMATIEWQDATLCFIPDWAQWSVRAQMELREEAA